MHSELRVWCASSELCDCDEIERDRGSPVETASVVRGSGEVHQFHRWVICKGALGGVADYAYANQPIEMSLPSRVEQPPSLRQIRFKDRMKVTRLQTLRVATDESVGIVSPSR